MSKARERQKRRKQRQQTTSKITQTAQQALPVDRINLPSVPKRLPFNRLYLIVPGALILLFAVVSGLGLINPPETESSTNAIWLDRRWTLATNTDDSTQILVERLRDNRVQTVFAYVSSLKVDGSWSGLRDGNNRFTEAEPILIAFVEQWQRLYPEVELYAWIEVVSEIPTGEGQTESRLDSEQIQNTVASFSQRMIETVGFDGILIDVKPVFNPNEDYLTVLRGVRSAIGLDVPLAVAVPPDLTPADTDLTLADQILPGTEWDTEFKQRVALQADFVVVQAYNSYLERPVDYLEWVTYQVDAWNTALAQIEAEARMYISVPNYADQPPAHDAQVETLSPALDGVRRGLQGTNDASDEAYLAGIALFTDTDLSEQDWRLFEDKWLNR